MDVKIETIKTLKKKFELNAQGYVKMLCEMWHLDEYYGFWVGDEIGGVWCYGDCTAITYEDIRVLVERQVPFDKFMEYDEYCSWAIEFGQDEPNLSSWLKGCPRHSTETMKRLKKLKEEFEQACKEASESLF